VLGTVGKATGADLDLGIVSTGAAVSKVWTQPRKSLPGTSLTV
jgi:hypothetical protein